jgi:hypothetical protein
VATTYETPGLVQPYPYIYAQDPGISPSTASDLTVAGDRANEFQDSPRPKKRFKKDQLGGTKAASSPVMKAAVGNNGNTNANASAKDGANAATDQAANKPKRVRTGCLTCRERHLKCDEGLPICQNCRKSNRQCKRGVRLNFIDTQVKAPAVMAPTHDWSVTFLDESREIASEYKGGRSRYLTLDTRPQTQRVSSNNIGFDFSSNPTAPAHGVQQHQALPPIQGMVPETFQDDQSSLSFDAHGREIHHQHAHSHSESTFSGSNMPTTAGTSYGTSEHQLPAIGEIRDYIRDPNEVLYMQVFVEEVGIWMDSMDSVKHVRLEQTNTYSDTNWL